MQNFANIHRWAVDDSGLPCKLNLSDRKLYEATGLSLGDVMRVLVNQIWQQA